MISWRSMFILLALIAVAAARPDNRYRYSEESKEDSRSYEFDFKVQEDSDELDFGQTEKKSGGKVDGYYYVLMPDTRTKKVTYYVDGDSGFVADVSYEGDAKFDSKEKSSEYKRYY